jgi:alanyl-tRNA synthetase
VFESDDEAADIWHKQEGVPKERIYRFGEKDNFWRMGNSGPCGPCSEIFYDMGPDVPGDPKENVMGGSGDRFIEFWNLVFMQYNESEDGKKTLLPKPSVDTGCGLERLSTILQGKLSNYDNDLFQTLIGKAEAISGLEYLRTFKHVKDSERALLEARNVAMRVLADHARATAFLMADGVLPSNDGRGYVLRRIMRRAIRYGRNLSIDQSFLPNIVETVIQEMADAYPELKKQSALILTHTRDEEKRFLQTLDQGTHILAQELERLSRAGKKVLDGKTAFKLYDTFGFPLDLTKLMVKEKGFDIDEASFEAHFEAARAVAKASWKGKALSGSEAHYIKWSQELNKRHGTTEFLGYSGVISGTSPILALSNGAENVTHLKVEAHGVVVTQATPFYAESGGQVGDTGLIKTAEGEAEVLDTTKLNDIHLHHVRIVDGELKVGDLANLNVNASARRSTANNHSATHLLHAALRKVLGSHVTQAGSLVAPDKLRFDFTHNKPLSPDESEAIEDLVNLEITRSTQVETTVMSPDAAVKAGALALFGEKYGDKVRVLKIGDFSMELCGGTHVENSAQIRLFKIVSESGVSAGVRRIEAITGEVAARYALKNIRENQRARIATGITENWTNYMQNKTGVADYIEKIKAEKKALEKSVQFAKGAQVDVKALASDATAFTKDGKKGRYVFQKLPVDDKELLAQLADKTRDQLGTGAVVLVGQGEDSLPMVVAVSKDLVGTLHAGKILGLLAEAMGGKGGGRPDFAQGAGKDSTKLNVAKQTLLNLFNS